MSRFVSKSKFDNYPSNWKDISKQVRKRDNCCFRCKKTFKQLRSLGLQIHSHHIFSAKTGNHTKRNLVSICETCHRKEHKHMRKFK